MVGVLVSVLLVTSCTQLRRFAYEGFGRDAWQQPERVVASLAIRPGDQIADLGSGGGYFTFRLATAVGPEGRVHAVDVDEGMNAYVADEARERGYANVDVVLAAYDDPKIPEPGVDNLFTCNTYHHLEDRTHYFRNAQKYLRSGGRVAIIEYAPKSGWFQRLFGHATEEDVIRSEMEAAGYSLLEDHDFLSRQSFLVFEAP
jgi:cyclopropane fatty-acyl-phospholipid synthase-like methyltransferase